MSCFSCPRRRLVPERDLRLFTREELESATSGFSAAALLGRGSHGSVFLASFDNGSLLAAAKLPTPQSFASNEIAVLSSLPQSPFLVNIIGRVAETSAAGEHISITEFMPGGSLYELIHPSFPGPPPNFRLRLRVALRAAEALASIHALQPPVLHRDIKPSNILLDAGGHARLTDFGLAVRGLPSEAFPAGTMGYLDPAYVSPGDLSVKTDVYSFGVVLLELISGRRAIDVEYSPASVVKWSAGLVAAGKFDELWDPRGGGPGCAAEELAALGVVLVAARCVGAVPEGRPAMDEVVRSLRSAGLIAGYSAERRFWWIPARIRRVANVAAERWRDGG
ncbi:Serine/threonine-protein kinase-like protein [Platanthera zijinensis]|uniref:Serine/threonine-protein kinase-like protein n=1 Tax=Platanthera zijinensis TaxID=2320716 RepID=A0AAP0G680_9ASPA